MQKYKYVGPKDIVDRVAPELIGFSINTVSDIHKWIQKWEESVGQNSGTGMRGMAMIEEEITATFVINEQGQLLVSDRHSEHVVCAGGKNVLSAGEISFSICESLKGGENRSIQDTNTKLYKVSKITNQSTGYCPRPESWEYVQKALSGIGVEHPDNFTNSFDFRFCFNCENINLIKESFFECAICGNDLDLEWNF